jgi:tripartite ATP-independent transporter DctP family solute receptor
MRKIASAFIVVCLFGMLAMTGAAEAVTLKLAHVVNEQDAFHVCALKFKEIVEERTDGEVKVTVFPNAKLGDERTLLENMKMGVVDAGVITSGPIINFIPEFGVFDLPFLFRSPEHAYAVLDGPIGKSLLAKMEEQGWKGLAYGERGFRNLTNSKHSVAEPADLEGLKIRLMENPVYVDTFKALGANAVPMAWTETLTALQQKTIDGQENPLNVIVSFKLYESQDFLSMTRHAYAPNVIMMSKKSWDKLSADQQAIVQEAAQKAAEANRTYDNDKAAEWLAFLKEQGMDVVEEPDLAAFREAVQPIYDKYGADFGEDMLQDIAETEAN